VWQSDKRLCCGGHTKVHHTMGPSIKYVSTDFAILTPPLPCQQFLCLSVITFSLIFNLSPEKVLKYLMGGPYPHYPLYCSQSEPCLSIGTVGQEKRWDFLSILSSVLQPSKVTRIPFGLKIIMQIDIK
jgi:hypothetical protein